MIGKMTPEEYAAENKKEYEKQELRSKVAFDLVGDFNKRLTDAGFTDDEIIRIWSFGLTKQLINQGVGIFSFLHGFQSNYDDFMIAHAEEQEKKYEPEKYAEREKEMKKKSEHNDLAGMKMGSSRKM
jgi:hypothetical protein